MKFIESKENPSITLIMNLQETIDLWRIVSSVQDRGSESADKFVSAMLSDLDWE